MEENLRVRLTKQALQESLLQLMEQKHVDRITVKELCENAHINRGTFYLHYTAPREILTEIEEELFEKYSALVAGAWQTFPLSPDSFSTLYDCLLEDRKMLTLILGPNGDPGFFNTQCAKAKPVVLSKWKEEFPNYPEEHLQFLFTFLINGSSSLMIEWLNRTQTEFLSPEEFSKRLTLLGHYCLMALKEF